MTNRMTRYRLTAAALALATTVLSGCGSADHTSANTSVEGRAAKSPTTVSHEAFVTKLNALCRNVNGKTQDLNTRLQNVTTKEEAASLYDEGVALANEYDPKLRSLTAPAEDRAAFTRYTQTVARQVGLTARLADAIRNDRQEALPTYTELLKQASKERVGAAIDLGADDCGQV